MVRPRRSATILTSSRHIWGRAMSLLSISNVRVSYGKAVALNGVSLRVEAGELVSLIGGNGAGKSTLMKAVMGLVPAAADELRFEAGRYWGCGPMRSLVSASAMCPKAGARCGS